MSTTAASSHPTALITGSLFSGAMLSLSLVAVPVLLDTTAAAPQLLYQWTRMYHYGHLALPTTAVATALLYAHAARRAKKEDAAARQSRSKPHNSSSAPRWQLLALAAAATLAMVPFTSLVMVPTNNELFRLQRESVMASSADVVGFAEVRRLVVSWSWMHLARSLMPLAGAVLGAVASVGV